jgi:osmotically-inducible protein OsmY
MKATSCFVVAFAALALGQVPLSARQAPPPQTYSASKSAPTAGQPVATADDSTLSDRAEAKLKDDAMLTGFDIDVSVKNAVATLTGSVRTSSQKSRAAHDARVPGVVRVDNQIKLDKDAGKSAADKVKDATDTAGKKTEQAISKTGEVVSDSWITTKVHSSFVGEDALKGSDINVDTSNHVVTLKGTVRSEAGRTRAIELARKIDGVTRVVDDLTIK